MRDKSSLGRPFFSIVIATYNNLAEFSSCLSSLEDQSFRDYELLVSDGGSKDGIAELLRSGVVANLSWYKSEKDCGIYDALNCAFTQVKGDWILVLGADDKLSHSESLSSVHESINDIENVREVGVVYSDIVITSGKGNRIKRYPNVAQFSLRYCGGPFIHHQSAFVARAHLLQVGTFDTKYQIHADYDLLLRVLSVSSLKKIDGVHVVYSANGFSSRWGNIWRSLGEVGAIRKSYGFSPFPRRILWTYLAMVLRKIYFGLRCILRGKE